MTDTKIRSVDELLDRERMLYTGGVRSIASFIAEIGNKKEAKFFIKFSSRLLDENWHAKSCGLKRMIRFSPCDESTPGPGIVIENNARFDDILNSPGDLRRADFAIFYNCNAASIHRSYIVEVDDPSHYGSSAAISDRIRDIETSSQGFKTLRIPIDAKGDNGLRLAVECLIEDWKWFVEESISRRSSVNA